MVELIIEFTRETICVCVFFKAIEAVQDVHRSRDSSCVNLLWRVIKSGGMGGGYGGEGVKGVNLWNGKI